LAEDVAVPAVSNAGFPAGDPSEEGFPIDRLAYHGRTTNIHPIIEGGQIEGTSFLACLPKPRISLVRDAWPMTIPSNP
jgi:hypothetical protein